METPAVSPTPSAWFFVLSVTALAVALVWRMRWPVSVVIGRWQIAHSLRRHFPAHCVHDGVAMPGPQGVHSLDHVVVARSGVHVIQLVAKHGRIDGGEHQAFWGVLRGKIHRRFANPLWDCEQDCHLISKRLGVRIDAVHPVVVFLAGAQLESDLPAGVYLDQEFVDHMTSDATDRLSASEIASINNTLAERQVSGVWPERRTRLH